jgi:AraC-like DNA-binding protein
MDLTFAGYYSVKLKAGNTSRDHAHQNGEIVYAAGSGGYIITGGRKLLFASGDILVHSPGVMHIAHTRQRAVHHCLSISGRDVARFRDGVYHGNAQIGRLFREIARELKDKKPFFQSIIEAKALEVVLQLKRIMSRAALVDGNARTDPEAVRIKQIIDAEFRKKIDLVFLSDQVMLSKDYLRHKFKEEFGVSPIQYLINKRIEKARRLISDEGKKVKEAAYECGFENEYYFSRLFKKVTGHAPSFYSQERKQKRATGQISRR